MRGEQFARYLENQSEITSKDKAVKSRVSKARRVEEKFNLDLDTVVIDDEKTYQTLSKIRDEFSDTNGAIQNAVRKYYSFVNSVKFASLARYEKLRIKK